MLHNNKLNLDGLNLQTVRRIKSTLIIIHSLHLVMEQWRTNWIPN